MGKTQASNNNNHDNDYEDMTQTFLASTCNVVEK